MRVRTAALLLLLTLGLLAAPVPAEAQKTGKVYRIGYLTLSGYGGAYYEAFWQGLRKLGYVDYKNFVIENRYAAGDLALLPNLAGELVRAKADLIVADSTPAALAAKNATTTIPVVVIAGDPVGSGLAASLARPGRNITGVASLTPELSVKRLELLKEAAPKVSHVAVIWHVAEPGAAPNLKETQMAARALGLKLLPLQVRGPADFWSAFAVTTKKHADALMIALNIDPVGFPYVESILDFARENQLPAMYSSRGFVEDGGLMSYGPSPADLSRRAAAYVDKILKGVNPGDLPVEQPQRFELAVNLKTAKALGLTIPPSVLVRADKIIE